MIDLHTHSTASDGVLSPADLVRRAAAAGLEALALTDHDTLSGLEEARDEARRVGLDFIPGVEISADFGPGTMHILGYFVEPSDGELAEAIAWLREGRGSRNDRILERLAALGYPVPWEEVAELARGESVGRPHIARAMVARGYVASFEEAFDRFLGKGAPAYEERARMTPEDSIARILRGGGLPVLAHPGTLGLEGGALGALVARLSSAGLRGLEVHYYDHSAEETRRYAAVAQEHGLLATGGSDFHGPGMLGTELGVGKGDLRVPRELADRLFEAHARGGGRR